MNSFQCPETSKLANSLQHELRLTQESYMVNVKSYMIDLLNERLLNLLYGPTSVPVSTAVQL